MNRSRSLPSDERLATLLAGVGIAQPGAARLTAPRVHVEPHRRVTRPVMKAAPSDGVTEPPEFHGPTAPPVPRDASLEAWDEESMTSVVRDAKTLDERFERLVRWMVDRSGAQGAFIADQDALPLASWRTPDSYLAATAALAEANRKMTALMPSHRESGTVVELEDGNVLQLVPAETASGRLTVGLVLSAPLSHVMVETLRQVVRGAVSAPLSR